MEQLEGLFIEYKDFVSQYKFIRRIPEIRHAITTLMREKSSNQFVLVQEKYLREKEEIRLELCRLQQLLCLNKSPYILKCKGYSYSISIKSENSGYIIYILFEYNENNLEKCLNQKRISQQLVNEQWIHKFLENLLKALNFIHKKGIPHGNLKPQNIFWINENEFKICSSYYTLPEYLQIIEGIFSHKWLYLAPELLNTLQTQSNYNDIDATLCDIYSLGIIVLQLAKCLEPQDLYNSNTLSINHDVLNQSLIKFEGQYSQTLVNLVACMIPSNPKERINASQLLKYLETNQKHLRKSSYFKSSITPPHNNNSNLQYLKQSSNSNILQFTQSKSRDSSPNLTRGSLFQLSNNNSSNNTINRKNNFKQTSSKEKINQQNEFMQYPISNLQYQFESAAEYEQENSLFFNTNEKSKQQQQQQKLIENSIQNQPNKNPIDKKCIRNLLGQQIKNSSNKLNFKTHLSSSKSPPKQIIHFPKSTTTNTTHTNSQQQSLFHLDKLQIPIHPESHNNSVNLFTVKETKNSHSTSTDHDQFNLPKNKLQSSSNQETFKQNSIISKPETLANDFTDIEQEKEQLIQQAKLQYLMDELGNYRENVFEINYTDNSKYIGNLLQDQRHGYGIYYYINNDIYCGEWNRNLFEGKGIYFYCRGDRYEGELIGGNKNGVGIYYYYNGNIYEGEWKNDKKHGKGIYIYYTKNEKYIGEFSEGKRLGQGTYYYANGDKYIGEWQNNVKNGKGQIQYSSGSIFTGLWIDNKANGFGKLQFTNGDIYEGNFVNGVRAGKGKYIHKDGTMYEGEWSNNEKNGIGSYYYQNGDKYVGSFKNGVRDGQGEYTYQNGDTYLGNWKDGDKEGQGKYLWLNKNTL